MKIESRVRQDTKVYSSPSMASTGIVNMVYIAMQLTPKQNQLPVDKRSIAEWTNRAEQHIQNLVQGQLTLYVVSLQRNQLPVDKRGIANRTSIAEHYTFRADQHILAQGQLT